jgi:hypothetical protein
LLDAEDFTAEQNYLREKLRRMNRVLHGAGVITGLNVSIHGESGAARVVVEPGVALDPHGEMVETHEPISLALPADGGELLVQIRYTEQPCNPAAVTGSEEQQYTRIEEAAVAVLAPSEDATGVPLARLQFTEGAWVVDAAFAPPRLKGR